MKKTRITLQEWLRYVDSLSEPVTVAVQFPCRQKKYYTGFTDVRCRASSAELEAPVSSVLIAYVRLGDKDIAEGYVTQWRDYDNSDVVQVLINGKFYLTHYSCVVLVADPSQGALQYDMGLAN